MSYPQGHPRWIGTLGVFQFAPSWVGYSCGGCCDILAAEWWAHQKARIAPPETLVVVARWEASYVGGPAVPSCIVWQRGSEFYLDKFRQRAAKHRQRTESKA